MAATPADSLDFDVIIVGAGLSGINSAYLLQKRFPDLRYTILEARDVIGGTWAFWKYPGVRSDSSSTVFSFSWYPWPHSMDFAEAGLIHDYVKDAAVAGGIAQNIRLRHRAGEMRWSSDEQMWTVDVREPSREDDDGNGQRGRAEIPSALPPWRPYRARWIIACSGYYSYDQAQDVEIPGLDRFAGEVVHPQWWTDKVNVEGKRVVLIGSGATAVTLLPNLVDKAAHVTMLQRSPSYVMARPQHDPVTALLKRWLPARLAASLNWYREMALEHIFVLFLLYFPAAGRWILRARTQRQLPASVPVDVHFRPRYDPFTQRLCMCPDGDFFRALHRPNCDIVTDHIATVTETGVRLRDGATELPADMIITATGLRLELLGNRKPVVDGVPVELGSRYTWRSCMVEGLPNTCIILGYTQGTWTPGADVHFRTILDVMAEMRRRGASSAWPTLDPARRAQLPQLSSMNLTANYVEKARDRLPMSSGSYPWISGRNYLYDAWNNVFGSVKDDMVYHGSKKDD